MSQYISCTSLPFLAPACAGEAKPNTVRVADPTEEPLPQAPSFKLYCLYGVGVPSDRAFHYVKSPAPRNSAAANISSDEDGVWTVNSLANDPDTGLVSGGCS